MPLEAILQEMGFSESEATLLANHDGFHHKRKTKEELETILKNISLCYDGDAEAVKKAILTFPQFAGLDHERVIRQKSRVGRLVGMSDEDVRNKLLTIPVLASYSARRYLAAIDIGRTLVQQGYEKSSIFDLFFKYHQRSPYVPHTERKRISQIRNYTEPPLLITMKKALTKMQK